LKYFFGKPTLNVRKSWWLEFLSEHEFDIKNIKGKDNKVDDALNRRVHEMHATTISMYKLYLKDKNVSVCKIRSALCGNKDKAMLAIKNALQFILISYHKMIIR
jgi:hypothetical protein